ncbi:outer membrane protein [Chelatococcus sp. GCM10030263]|uniref:outer membrane protein n=1 Tax=Chelatococcus sp. GCM10030263 TaxID=3273387 RepID=UPI00360D1ED1
MRARLINSLFTIACTIGIPAAFASDLPRRPSLPPAPLPPAFTWTGAYAGLDVGYGLGRLKTKAIWAGSTDAVATALPDSLRGTIGGTGKHRKGFGGGLHVGYDHQFGWMVAGLEADVMSIKLQGTGVAAASLVDPVTGARIDAAASGSQRLHWFATLRPRIGFLPFERLLIYGTGGLAVGRASNRVQGTVAVTAPGSDMSETTSFGAYGKPGSGYRFGWVVGAGAEYALTDDISIKGEFLHINLAGRNFVAAVPQPDSGEAAVLFKNKTAFEVMKAGVNYRF